MKLRPECIFINFYERNRMTEEIRKQILAIRDTGRSNMFDVPAVQRIAHEMEFYELVVFLEESTCNSFSPARRSLNTKMD